MIERIIDRSLKFRGWVVAGIVALTIAAIAMTSELKLDALPDLSEGQVIVKASFPGQPPELVEDQVTYPLTAALVGVPGATTVRAWSMFGEAYVYVVLDERTDPYWARSRILERLSQIQSRLPAGATTALGPDASGVGWIFQYALVAKRGDVPIGELRALQDFLVSQELQSVPGVAEVATFGGGARQLQVDVDPVRLEALGVTVGGIAQAVRDANRATGGGAIELGRQRMLISADARIDSRADLLDVPVGRDANGALVRLNQVAHVSVAPAPRQNVADLDGAGDTVGGIVVMRQGENANETVRLLKDRLAALGASLPDGVEIVTTYDRSTIIRAAVASLAMRLVEEGAIVAVVCGLFLWRLRSAFVIILTLPVGLLIALAILQWQGITANIMSLGGLAIAIGAMVDAAVVMVEALHRKLEQRSNEKVEYLSLVRECAREVGPALFFSLLIITVSFLPVLSLQGQEGKLFSPLALTKTYAMAAAAVLSITLVPVLMTYFIRRPVPPERANPLNRALRRVYRPLLVGALRRPVLVIAGAAVVAASIAVPIANTGSEFMPPLDEGDLLYMPTTLPAVSLDEAAAILRTTNRLILEFPQVARVHGKAGRSDSATDPAPLSMIETVILLKPRSEWPEPISTAELIRRLEARVKLAGLSNSWGFPIRTRIDMLATGVKTPLALRIAGPDRHRIQSLSVEAEAALRSVPGIRSVFTERTDQGRYIDVEIDRARANVHGVTAADVASLLAGPVGGAPVDTMSIGRERYPIVVRYPRADRDSLDALSRLRLATAAGSTVELSQVATVRIADGASMIRSENARPVGYVLVDMDDADTGGVIERAQAALEAAGIREQGYTLSWGGQYPRLQAASDRLLLMSAATLLSVVLILYWHFRCWRRVAIVMASLPFAATGGAWLMSMLGLRWSFASAVGFLALAGIAAEFCVVMLLYLDQEMKRHGRAGADVSPMAARHAVVRGALLRLRPKMMTVAVILGGLIPLMVSNGPGVDVMRPVAAPMIGGMITAPLFSLLVVPVVYLAMLRRT